MGKIKNLLIIQPHSDDALFSASHFFLGNENYNTTVLTVENNTKRLAEDKKLYDFLNIEHIDLSDVIPVFDDRSFYGFNDKVKEITIENCIDWLRGSIGDSVLNRVFEEFSSFLHAIEESEKYDVIAVPLGIGHPFHVFIRFVVEDNILSKQLLFYRDFPHSYKKRAKKQFEQEMERYVMKYSVAVDEFHDVKWSLAKKFYKTQSGLLWYEQGYINKQLPEEIYIRL